MLDRQRDEIGEGRLAHLDGRRRRAGPEEVRTSRPRAADALRQDARHLARRRRSPAIGGAPPPAGTCRGRAPRRGHARRSRYARSAVVEQSSRGGACSSSTSRAISSTAAGSPSSAAARLRRARARRATSSADEAIERVADRSDRRRVERVALGIECALGDGHDFERPNAPASVRFPRSSRRR